MAGYDYYRGMSNNAVDAYTRGIKPLSRITLDDLRNAGWEGTLTFARSLAKTEIWESAEWHHSCGTYFAKIDFYDPKELVEIWNNLSDQEKSEVKDAVKEQSNEDMRVIGRYATFSGSRKRPHFDGYVSFTGTKKGNWIYLDGGGRKKASGNHISYEAI